MHNLRRKGGNLWIFEFGAREGGRGRAVDGSRGGQSFSAVFTGRARRASIPCRRRDSPFSFTPMTDSKIQYCRLPLYGRTVIGKSPKLKKPIYWSGLLHLTLSGLSA
ncbi:hypothetical protein SLE2022_230210 [Rubroshorea leprosula]